MHRTQDLAEVQITVDALRCEGGGPARRAEPVERGTQPLFDLAQLRYDVESEVEAFVHRRRPRGEALTGEHRRTERLREIGVHLGGGHTQALGLSGKVAAGL